VAAPSCATAIDVECERDRRGRGGGRDQAEQHAAIKPTHTMRPVRLARWAPRQRRPCTRRTTTL